MAVYEDDAGEEQQWKRTITNQGVSEYRINERVVTAQQYNESLEAEKEGLALYRRLFELTRDRSVLLEDYARRMICEEEQHIDQVVKMLRKPGEISQST